MCYRQYKESPTLVYLGSEDGVNYLCHILIQIHNKVKTQLNKITSICDEIVCEN